MNLRRRAAAVLALSAITTVFPAACRANPSMEAATSATRARDDGAAATSQDARTAEGVLARAGRRYAEAKTYREKSTATLRTTEQGTEREKAPPVALAIEVLFERGGGCLWRVEERSTARPPTPFVVWSPDGTEWSSHWTFTGQMQRFGGDVGGAFAAASGISNGTSALIVPLLFPGAMESAIGRGATDLREPQVVGREPLAGAVCDVVRGRSPVGDDAVTLWIDEAGAIRRIERERIVDFSGGRPVADDDGSKELADAVARVKPFVSRTSVELEATFDAPIPRESFDYRPSGPTEAAPSAAATAPTSAIEPLQRARKRYASAKTYRDEVRISAFRGEPGGVIPPEPTQRLVATTRSEQGGGFFWSFRDEGRGPQAGPYVVWSPDGKEWTSHWGALKRTKQFGEDVRMAFAETTGISLGTTTVVLPLLLARNGTPILGAAPLDLADATLGGREELGGVACDVVKGRSPGGVETTLWIDADGAIRKVRRSALVDASSFPPSDDPEQEKVLERLREAKPWTSVTIYEIAPTFDAPIAAEEFTYVPPPSPAGAAPAR